MMESFYRQFVREGHLVFDVGAFHGSRTRVFRAIGARVVAVEPVKESLRVLFARFGADPGVTLVPRAVGAASGTAEILVSGPHRFSSSLSEDYVRAAIESGRYARYGVESWEERRRARVTTMDELIAEHGVPSFAKIDVEGLEDAVLEGLSRPIQALSFEFHPHALGPARRSLDLLARLGDWRLNFAIEERFTWSLDAWAPLPTMRSVLDRLASPQDFLYGDIYARLERTGGCG